MVEMISTKKKVSAKPDNNAKQQEIIASSSAEHSYQDLSSDENIASETYGSHQTLPPNLLDPNEFVPVNEDNIETDTKDFIIIPHPTPFACAVTINKLPRNSLPILSLKQLMKNLLVTMYSKGSMLDVS